MGPDDHVDPGRPSLDLAPVLLRETSAHDDPEPRMGELRWFQVSEVAVELVVGVLTDRAGVEHHDTRVGDIVGPRHTVGVEQPGDALRVMLVHLAAEGADQVGALHGTEGIGTPVPRSHEWVSSPAPKLR